MTSADINRLPVNQHSNFERLAEDIRRSLLDWIQANVVPVKTLDPRHDSYTLKHQFERDTGHYVDNGEFKGAMRHLGFEPKDLAHGVNWVFRTRLKRKTKSTPPLAPTMPHGMPR